MAEWLERIKNEIEWKFVLSGGPGGQNVNKTSSAAQLRWNLWTSKCFNFEEKNRIFEKIHNILTGEGDVLLKSSEFRDQSQNQSNAFEKLVSLLQKALFVPKKRIKTKPHRGAVKKRLESKKRHGEKKKDRTTRYED